MDNSFIKDNIEIYFNKGNNIIFDSGIISIVFPSNYIPLFEDFLSNNKLLINAKCEIKSSKENAQIFYIFLEKINIIKYLIHQFIYHM